MLKDVELEEIDSLVEKHDSKQSALIAILLEIQDKYGYLPKKSLVLVCERLGLPISQAYSVATFYKAFSFSPRGKHLIKYCVGSACQANGTQKILKKLEKELELGNKDKENERKFTIEKVHCLGCCGVGPNISVDDDLYGHITNEKLKKILKKYK